MGTETRCVVAAGCRHSYTQLTVHHRQLRGQQVHSNVSPWLQHAYFWNSVQKTMRIISHRHKDLWIRTFTEVIGILKEKKLISGKRGFLITQIFCSCK